MKKIEIKTKHEFHYQGKKRFIVFKRDEWIFTPEEKESIENDLRGRTSATHQDIRRFISHLEFYCQHMKMIKATPKEREAKKNRKQALKIYKEALQQTQEILKGTTQLINLSRIPDNQDDKSVRQYDFLNRYAKWALELKAPLQRMIQALEDNLKERLPIGRREADYEGLVTYAAGIYQRYIGKPTKYLHGPFCNIIETALESLNLPSKGLIRKVSKGIDRLPELEYKKGQK